MKRIVRYLLFQKLWRTRNLTDMTHTLSDTWFRPFWEMLMLPLLRQVLPNLLCLFVTVYLEYHSVLSPLNISLILDTYIESVLPWSRDIYSRAMKTQHPNVHQYLNYILNILSQRISCDFMNTKIRQYIYFISFNVKYPNVYTHAHSPTVDK